MLAVLLIVDRKVTGVFLAVVTILLAIFRLVAVHKVVKS